MFAQAVGHAQSPLSPHNTCSSFSLHTASVIVKPPTTYKEVDKSQIVTVEVSEQTLEGDEHTQSHLATTEPSRADQAKLGSLEGLSMRVKSRLDKISAAISWQAALLPLRQTIALGREQDFLSSHLSRRPEREHIEGADRQSGHQACLLDQEEGQDENAAFLYDTGHERKSRPEDWEHDNRIMDEIPQYVLEYAPLVHLFSGEQFWPCDIADHLNHVTPNLNYTPIRAQTDNLNLTNLDELNEYDGGRFVYLKSDDNVEERPDWLGGQKNIPDEPEDATAPRHPHRKPSDSQRQEPPQRGHSSAPAVLVAVNKGHGIVDAFWFYFYSYNLGNVVLNIRFGNHVGDWEHSLIRFQHGKPKIVFFSEHFFGQAYTYDAVEKIGKRPVVYSAVGTHAMYATPGRHPYIFPLGLLHDQTDRGPLWDPAMNCMQYIYDVKKDALTPDNRTAHAPTEWFYFDGHWGDKLYPLDDRRQYAFAGQYHYVTGPLGPRWKHLGRRKVCQGPYKNDCVIKERLEAEGEGEIPIYPGPGAGEGEEEGMEDLAAKQRALERDKMMQRHRRDAEMRRSYGCEERTPEWICAGAEEADWDENAATMRLEDAHRSRLFRWWHGLGIWEWLHALG